ncbi:hypothetical protein [uncultured Ilyobacter sp.]|nr:hypothetical protein [uncultured Ilyobacter sp.]
MGKIKTAEVLFNSKSQRKSDIIPGREVYGSTFKKRSVLMVKFATSL